MNYFVFMQNKGKLRIHEDSLGNIYVAGATEVKVSSHDEVRRFSVDVSVYPLGLLIRTQLPWVYMDCCCF